jgi:hypothetical protein
LSTYAKLVERAAELRRANHSFAEIAEILNREGWSPAKRRDTFNAPMVHHLYASDQRRLAPLRDT